MAGAGPDDPDDDAPLVPAEPDCAPTTHWMRWFAVHTQPYREARAQAHLTRQGFRVFVPSRLKTVRHARKLKMVNAPFFPRYLFIAFDPSCCQWRSVNSTFGVSTLVMAGDRPQPVPAGVVEAMVASTNPNGLLSFEHSLKLGSQVRLLAGPFAEQLGILDRLDDSGRVRVLLQIMGGTIPVRLARELVAPA